MFGFNVEGNSHFVGAPVLRQADGMLVHKKQSPKVIGGEREPKPQRQSAVWSAQSEIHWSWFKICPESGVAEGGLLIKTQHYGV